MYLLFGHKNNWSKKEKEKSSKTTNKSERGEAIYKNNIILLKLLYQSQCSQFSLIFESQKWLQCNLSYLERGQFSVRQWTNICWKYRKPFEWIHLKTYLYVFDSPKYSSWDWSSIEIERSTIAKGIKHSLQKNKFIMFTHASINCIVCLTPLTHLKTSFWHQIQKWFLVHI